MCRESFIQGIRAKREHAGGTHLGPAGQVWARGAHVAGSGTRVGTLLPQAGAGLLAGLPTLHALILYTPHAAMSFQGHLKFRR